jgi:hypothetical protein
MTNTENLRKVAQVIREHHDQFNLSDWASDDPNPLHNCGTACCIAGWTNAIIAQESNLNRPYYMDTEGARDYLGLDYYVAEELFIPSETSDRPGPWTTAKRLGLYPEDKSPYDATAEEAATILEAIADGRITE